MAGTWHDLKRAPGFTTSTMLLLTDGRVICQEDNSTRWFALRPDGAGSYLDGTWAPIAQAHHARRYYASAVLRDGRVFVAGGEQSATDAGGDINKVEIYDPVLDTWTEIAPPPGWDNIGDAPCCLLADGRVLLGDINSTRTVIFDPTQPANPWTPTGDKNDPSSEETWTLLRDGSVLTVDCNPPTPMASQRYIPASGTWVDAGSTQVDLVDHGFSTEIGPAVLLDDGRVFAMGGTGHTSIYSPISGTWTPGPDLPNGTDQVRMTVHDAPAALLPNGRVLCCAGLGSQGWGGTTYFFEFDPVTSTLAAVGQPGNYQHDPFWGRMMLLPTGQVLYVAGSNEAALYTPDGHHNEHLEPAITSVPTTLTAGHTVTVHGVRFNGMSQAVMYGDDCTAATNYPLARLRYPNGTVVYCRTHGHSTMAVATGHAHVHTRVHVPSWAPEGHAHLEIVANGVPSDAVRVEVEEPWWRRLLEGGGAEGAEAWLILIGSLADGTLIVIGPDGRPHRVPPLGPPELVEAVDAAAARVNRSLADLQAAFARLDQATEAAAAARLAEGPPVDAVRTRGGALAGSR